MIKSKSRHLSPAERKRLEIRLIYLLQEEGASQKEAAGLIGVCPATVCKMVKKLKLEKTGKREFKKGKKDTESANAFVAAMLKARRPYCKDMESDFREWARPR